MSSYAPDVRQFNKQRHADERRHREHLQRQQAAANSDGLSGTARTSHELGARIGQVLEKMEAITR